MFLNDELEMPQHKIEQEMLELAAILGRRSGSRDDKMIWLMQQYVQLEWAIRKLGINIRHR